MNFEARREYKGIEEAGGPLVFVRDVKGIGIGETAIIRLDEKRTRSAKVIETGRDFALLEVFNGTSGINPQTASVRFTGRPFEIGVSESMLGRVFDGLGNPMDGLADIIADEFRDVDGGVINPTSRDYPRDFILTGISAIDIMNTLICGQKLPVFSAGGLAHNRIAAQIAAQAHIDSGDFCIVFTAMGVKRDDAGFFIDSFEESGALKHSSLFINLADSPAIERLITPRVALTFAEYLAFDKNKNVLVILTDMTNYCEALREVASAKSLVPARKGFPGYMYSDLASLYERAGRIKGKAGSITQIPILTMPNDDITHPIPDLTGYITEGQIVLSRNLAGKGIYPPIDLPLSLSRLMKDGIGENKTREDHPRLATQILSSYARALETRSIASVIGEDELPELEKKYLKFAENLEKRFINQGIFEERILQVSFAEAWEALSALPKSELSELTEEDIKAYYSIQGEEE
jgi:V/A-type H+-transporting ATPase subunit B